MLSFDIYGVFYSKERDMKKILCAMLLCAGVLSAMDVDMVALELGVLERGYGDIIRVAIMYKIIKDNQTHKDIFLKALKAFFKEDQPRCRLLIRDVAAVDSYNEHIVSERLRGDLQLILRNYELYKTAQLLQKNLRKKRYELTAAKRAIANTNLDLEHVRQAIEIHNKMAHNKTVHTFHAQEGFAESVSHGILIMSDTPQHESLVQFQNDASAPAVSASNNTRTSSSLRSSRSNKRWYHRFMSFRR